MLPSTKYFKSFTCPFYEMGFCERPYCHFKHRKLEENLQSAPAAPEAASSTIVKTETDTEEYCELPDGDTKQG